MSLELILQCILVLQSQIIDFTHDFYQAYIPGGEPVIIELPRNFKIDGGQCDIFIRLNEILYVQANAAHLCYEKLRNGLIDHGFAVSKMDK